MALRLALHTWTLLGTPFTDILEITPATGWDGIEIAGRHVAPNHATALPLSELERLVRASGLPLACISVDPGWLWAEGDDRRKLLETFDQRCRLAAALDGTTVMGTVGAAV